MVGLCPPSDSNAQVQRQGIIDAQGQRWVVCAPFEASASVNVAAQVRILKLLHRAWETGLVPFDVPVIEAQSHNPKNPGIYLHRLLPGDTLDENQLSGDPAVVISLATALASLHALPKEVVEKSDLPIYSASDCRERYQALLDEGVKAWTIPANLYERWDTALDNVALFKFSPTVVHGDLSADAFTVSGSTVRTIASFANAHLGDPAEDLQWITSYPDIDVVEKFFHTYNGILRSRVDLHLRSRCQLYSEMALVKWLLHGYRSEDQEIVEDAQQMLNQLSVDVGQTPLVEYHYPRSESPQELDAPETSLADLPQVTADAPTVDLSAVIEQLLQEEDYE